VSGAEGSLAGHAFRPELPPHDAEPRKGRVVSFDFATGTCLVEFPNTSLHMGQANGYREAFGGSRDGTVVEFLNGWVVLEDGTQIPCTVHVERGSLARGPGGQPSCKVVPPERP